MQNRGCVIYAFKKPAYGKMAWNLCMSIKSVSPNMPVAVVHDGLALDHLEDWRQKHFDRLILMDTEDMCHIGKFSPGKGKLSGYKYLPFDENIIIDADSICINDVNRLFEMCTKNVHAQCVGSWNETATTWSCQWMDLIEARKLYSIEGPHTIYEINSSFVYIKKSSEAENLYARALENLKIGWGHPELQNWGGGFPDELGWNVAFAQLGIHPQFSHQSELSNDAQEPIFFSTRFTNHWGYVHDKYYFIGFFGDAHFTDASLQNYYDRLMIGIGRKFGFDHHFKIRHLMKAKHVKEK